MRYTGYSIVKKNDHYEVYVDGQFYCTADSMEEAIKELDELSEGA